MMNRRAFLGLLGVAAPAAAVASKIGLWDKFLAWIQAPAPQPIVGYRIYGGARGGGKRALAELHASLQGIPYYVDCSHVGPYMGISRAPEVERWIRAQEFWRGDQHISAEQFDDWDEDEAA